MKNNKRLKRFTITVGNFSIRFQKCEYDTDMKPTWKKKLLGIELSSYTL